MTSRHVLFVAFFAIFCLVQTQAQGTCFQDNIPLEDLNKLGGAWMNVFLDLAFTCDEQVQGWQFYADAVGVFYAGVWRPSSNGSTLMLVGRNQITVDATGIGRTYIEPNSQIMAQPGDVIGVHYDVSADEFTGGIIPYEDSRFTSGGTLCCNLQTSDLSRISNDNFREEDFSVGSIINTNEATGVLRLPALTPILESTWINAMDEIMSNGQSMSSYFVQYTNSHIIDGLPQGEHVKSVAACADLCVAMSSCTGFDFNYGRMSGESQVIGPFRGVACWLHEAPAGPSDTVTPTMEVDFFWST